MRNKLIKASDRRVEKEGYCGLLAHNTQSAMLFIIPSLIVLSFVILYPIIRSLILSFYNYELLKPGVMNFVFLDNFKTLFKDEIFWISFKNTVIFTGFTVSICIVLGLVIAIAFDQLPIKFEKYRGLILIPWVIPGVVSGFLFRYMFDFEIGIVNYVLKSLHIIKEYLPWLTQGNLAMIAIIVTHIWSQTPFYVLMFAAGLKAIPKDIQEAVYVEGAGRWQEFRHITLPFLKGVLLITSLLMVISNFNTFPIIFAMTGGGPVYSTTTSVIYIFKLAFEQFEMSYASAVGIFWAFILLIISILYIRLLQKEF